MSWRGGNLSNLEVCKTVTLSDLYLHHFFTPSGTTNIALGQALHKLLAQSRCKGALEQLTTTAADCSRSSPRASFPDLLQPCPPCARSTTGKEYTLQCPFVIFPIAPVTFYRSLLLQE